MFRKIGNFFDWNRKLIGNVFDSNGKFRRPDPQTSKQTDAAASMVIYKAILHVLIIEPTCITLKLRSCSYSVRASPNPRRRRRVMLSSFVISVVKLKLLLIT